jgi:hypothetical protein
MTVEIVVIWLETAAAMGEGEVVEDAGVPGLVHDPVTGRGHRVQGHAAVAGRLFAPTVVLETTKVQRDWIHLISFMLI